MSINIEEMAQKMARLIQDSGGEIIGRIRLQKIAFLLELAGEGEGFSFTYHHYGPYSEDLSAAAEFAQALGKIKESSTRAAWGGYYSTYSLLSDTDNPSGVHPPSKARKDIIDAAKSAGSIVLELAATAAYFAATGVPDPWDEVRRRKEGKATDERIDDAKNLYVRIRKISNNIPAINQA